MTENRAIYQSWEINAINLILLSYTNSKVDEGLTDTKKLLACKNDRAVRLF